MEVKREGNAASEKDCQVRVVQLVRLRFNLLPFVKCYMVRENEKEREKKKRGRGTGTGKKESLPLTRLEGYTIAGRRIDVRTEITNTPETLLTWKS